MLVSLMKNQILKKGRSEFPKKAQHGKFKNVTGLI
jgi:hypothetical protein